MIDCNYSSTRFDVAAVRREFPALDQSINGHLLVYLDNAATTQKPRCVIDAVSHFYERNNANVHRAMHELAQRATTAFEGARDRLAEFIHAASSEEIVFTRGTTEAINLVAAAWGDARLQRGDQILLTPMEHHSNLVPWQRLAARTGAELRFLPLHPRTGMLELTELDRWLNPKVKLLSVTHVSNVLGVRNPVEQLCAEASQRGILSLVDAAQSAGHMRLDVQSIGCDFLAFSGHKMCGPTGIGVLFGRREILLQLDPWQGGGEMIESVELERSTYAPPPQRFEAGTPDIAGAIGLQVAAEFLDLVGRDAIHHHVQSLASEAARRLRALPGVRVLGPEGDRTGVVAFAMEGVHPHDLATVANESGVALRAGHHCAQPLLKYLGMSSVTRASFHCYNTPEEVDRLLETVESARRLLA